MRITKKSVAEQIQNLDISVDVDDLVKNNTMLMLQQMLKDLQEPASSEPTEVWNGPSKMLYDASISFNTTEDGKKDFRNPQYDPETNYLLTYQLTFFGGHTATAKFQKIQGKDWDLLFTSGRLEWMWKNVKQQSGKTPDSKSAMEWIEAKGKGYDATIVAVEQQQNQKSQENPHDAH